MVGGRATPISSMLARARALSLSPPAPLALARSRVGSHVACCYLYRRFVLTTVHSGTDHLRHRVFIIGQGSVHSSARDMATFLIANLNIAASASASLLPPSPPPSSSSSAASLASLPSPSRTVQARSKTRAPPLPFPTLNLPASLVRAMRAAMVPAAPNNFPVQHGAVGLGWELYYSNGNEVYVTHCSRTAPSTRPSMGVPCCPCF